MLFSQKIQSQTEGSRYEGQFLNDMRNGQGVFYFKEGGYYNGTYLDDKANGQGERLYPNGDKYSGNWRKNRRNGEGVLTVATTGQQVKGFWENDALL